MTYVVTGHFTPSRGVSAGGVRDLAFDRERCREGLAGRTTWRMTGLPQAAGRLEVDTGDPLIWPTVSPVSEPRDRDIDADALRAMATLVEERIGVGDVVVAHDPLSALLAPVVRACGGHLVLHVGVVGSPATGAVDAYVQRSRRLVARTLVLERVAALVPAADVLTTREVNTPPAELHPEMGWSSVLTDVVATDRRERVGGTLHVRPIVATR